ncbi:cobalt-precorrin-5B (C(1))-methyltransferase CbiD [Methylovulum psychrotolerans]|uniref:cobalt-precorrin-5B (C(1))-methyltransferase CbiD n=1 Tax=Methylovulum psychrotolerans TaxID=1704499 RepID=UPI000CDE68A9|nr:cobalt-precorrin-5B (C(1))-methyltransferase CbiD [Methylovulum psychrotolerans]
MQPAPPPDLQEFSLAELAPNGLRRGRTTGSCATAAVKAALTLLLQNRICQQTAVTLPDQRHYLSVPIEAVFWLDAHSTRAEVRKDGGDDPDNTHGAIIFAEVRKNAVADIRFFAGAGVGTATQPGLRVAVGEPAINPVPRLMMRQAVMDVLEQFGLTAQTPGFDLTIGCENGAVIAEKTFNPRLGIVGGISILGTSGIVEPLSLASWLASIDVYIRVALGAAAPGIALLPGKIGRGYAQQVLGLSPQQAVQMANFFGESLDFLQQALREEDRQLQVLWLLGHPGKLAKVLAGAWDTHSGKSAMAMAAVATVAADLGFTHAQVQAITQANTVEAIIGIVPQPQARVLWLEIERRIAALVRQRTPAVKRVEVRLFNLQGETLGSA